MTAADRTGELQRYYDRALGDYLRMWSNRDNLAMHLGYWDEHTKDHADSLTNMNRRMAEAAEVRPGERVLDAGCGAGGTALWLAEEFGVEVTGYDFAPGQIDQARTFAARRPAAARVRFEVRDLSDTGAPPGSFDIVWAQESLCHLTDRPAFLAEAYRLLAPGGRLVVEDIFATEAALGRAAAERFTAGLEDCAIPPPLPSRSEWHDWMAAADFEATRWLDISAHTAPSYRRLGRLMRINHPLVAGAHLLRLKSRTQLAMVRGLRAQVAAFEAGWLVPALSVAHKPLQRTKGPA
ncbi:MAG: methyltransferase domain-containing protein [Acidobacteriota bacterium]